MKVTASDGGSPPKSATVDVTIKRTADSLALPPQWKKVDGVDIDDLQVRILVPIFKK